ncbi:MAG: ribbon-helix-helix domain-containing protein [Magnetovibrionaceae bacterium]
MSQLHSKNVTIDGRRTSLRLEEEMWAALDEICHDEGVTLHELCTRIDRARQAGSRTSTIRAFIVMYFRAKAKGEAPRWGVAG